MRNAVLTSKVEGSTTIISIVPEGTSVKEGDLVCELDSSLLSDRETQQEILAAKAETAYNQGREDLLIQEILNKSETEAADLRLVLAEIDLEKFELGDLVQQKDELQNQKKLAEVNLSRAQESYDYVKRLARNGYRTQNDLESERIAVETQVIAMKLVEGQIKVLKDYTENRTLVELRAKVDECKREIQRTESRTRSALIQKKDELHARKLTYEVEHNKHERLQAQIKACKIFATQDGQVVYANTRDGRSSEQVLIEVGSAVRERQPIINLPDLDQMKVNAKIHESRISMVRPGMTAVIRVDAYSDETFHGRVDSVASVPSSTGGFSSNIKEYDAVIKIMDESDKVNKLRPGLTASTEILVERREDVLQIPLQANVTIGSKQFVFVVIGKQVEARAIKVGKTNANFIEILEGLVDGDEVVMNPHSRFQKEISDLEEAQAKEQAKEAPKSPDVVPLSSPAAVTNELAAVKPGEGNPAGGPGGRRRRSGGEDGAAGGPAGEGRPQGGFDPEARFTQMDKDHDGKVTKDEADERIAQNFERFDTDSDGSVTKEEFLAAIAKFRGNGGRPRPPAADGGN
ncbi:efflux RND transporter periplasmic adaptor subunit [Schlesneria paludicola]|uniref:efflux RND transporter periplasmic adaptor subunit n=1 Tax=Schlesneria paludicola TaxID=360056 RepID=UPI00029B45BD|nr:efflux RND transporter periplasmic adaptor subunit [Schlesneria paludicola]